MTREAAEAADCVPCKAYQPDKAPKDPGQRPPIPVGYLAAFPGLGAGDLLVQRGLRPAFFLDRGEFAVRQHPQVSTIMKPDGAGRRMPLRAGSGWWLRMK